MSTTGKVLVVLVILVLPIWIAMVSAVAVLNNEGTQAVKKLQDQVVTAEVDANKAEADILEFKDQIEIEQHRTASESAVAGEKITELERARSQTLEQVNRLNNQLLLLQTSVANANLTKEHRIKEKADETLAIKNFEDEVEKLKMANSELMEQLAQLRSEFKNTYEQNKKLVERLSRSPQALRANAVSFVAPTP